jgi:hypothetical protein
MIARMLTLAEVAQALRWDRRSLVRALARHGIGVIGRGRLARLTAADVERLIEAERQPVLRGVEPSPPVDELVRRALRRSRAARVAHALRAVGPIRPAPVGRKPKGGSDKL